MSELKVHTEVYGKPIDIKYGETRVAPNLIWYANFCRGVKFLTVASVSFGGIYTTPVRSVSLA